MSATFLAVVALVVALLAIAAALAAAAVRAMKRKHVLANQVVPGVPTRAPVSWAGAHSREARLHRRLRDAVTALRANPALDRPPLLDLRQALEQEAIAVDNQLVAAAALPRHVGADAMTRVTGAVAAIEDAAGQLAALGSGQELAPAAAGISAVSERLALIAEARAELERIDRSAGLTGPPTTTGIEGDEHGRRPAES